MSTPTPQTLFNISGAKILIAGAAGGLGRPIAEFLSMCGAQLILLDSNNEKLAQLGEEIGGKLLRCDITNESRLAQTLADALPSGSELDGVVNAAGLLPIEAAENQSVAEFRNCLDANVTGAFLVSRIAAQHFGKQGGAIVHLASVSSLVSNERYAAYASSKAALSQLVRVLAREWAERHIRVNAIGPALTLTPLTECYLAQEEFLDQAINAIPMGRLGTPEDLLATILLLLTPGGRFITGQTIYVDGGRTLV